MFGLFAILGVAVLAMTAFNPLDTASWDPRMRAVGHAPFRAASSSMAPTLAAGDIVVVSAMSLRYHDLAVNDVVVFRPPNMPSQEFISRIVGLASDRVRIDSGRTWVNDRLSEN